MSGLSHSIEVTDGDYVTIQVGLDDVPEPLDIYCMEKSKEEYQELEVYSTYDPSIPKWQGVNQYPFRQEVIICGAFEHFVLTGYERTTEVLTIWGYLQPSYYDDSDKLNAHIPYDDPKTRSWKLKDDNYKVGGTAPEILKT